MDVTLLSQLLKKVSLSDGQVFSGNTRVLKVESPGTSLNPGNNEKGSKPQIVDINKQIRDLVRKRAELWKEGNVVGSETGSDLRQMKEGPLPQRTSKAKAKMVSNI